MHGLVERDGRGVIRLRGLSGEDGTQQHTDKHDRESGSRVQLIHLRSPTGLGSPRQLKESPVVLPAKSLGSRGLLPESSQKGS